MTQQRRVMSIWFPRLPLDRLARRGDARLAGILAITQFIKNAPRLTHVTEAAQKAGASVGQSLADARAICPELLTEPVDEDAQAQLLRALWRWADRLSPWAALDSPDGLFLDITGCAHLFGGETPMAEFTLSELAALNVTARIGMADTKGAAWALARYTGREISLALPGATRDAIADLPLKALSISAKTETDLRRTGLSKIGDIQIRKTSDLARRFGLELTQKLSKALGHEPDPVSPEAATPVYAARMTLPDPIGRLDDVMAVLRRLAESVCGRLDNDLMGARHFDLTVTCVDTGNHVLSAGFARPCQAVGAVLQQFTRPVDELRIEYGADRFRLVARHLEPVRPRQRILGGELQAKAEDFDTLISTLGNRLGFDRVRKFLPRDQHIPEGEFTTVEAVRSGSATWAESTTWALTPNSQRRERPLRLFPRPERIRTLTPGRPPLRFEWRGRAFDNVETSGPERLAPPWWETGDRRQRDYWQARTDTGEQLWLMNQPGCEHPDWFVAGQFA